MVRTIMEAVIEELRLLREEAEKRFVENSIYVHNNKGVGCVPDTNSDLEMIIELDTAIKILKEHVK